MALAFVSVSAVAVSCGGSSSTPNGPSALASDGVPFSVTGLVRDSLLRPIAGAKVEIDQGRWAGMSTLTNGQGRFTLEAPSVTTDIARLPRRLRLRGMASGESP